MKVIKLQAWERPFQERITDLRNIELNQLWRYSLANALSMMLWSGTPLAVALATFTAYVMLGNNLDVATALTSLALFEIIRFPLFMLPTSTKVFALACVFLARYIVGEQPGPISYIFYSVVSNSH
jgi:ATP-binding cassette, subfamily C (CFTR/MRP), member 1